MRSLLGILCVGISITVSTTASSLITVSYLLTPGDAYDIEVVGDLAYVADGRSGLRIIDVSNPAAPVEIGALDTPSSGRAWDIEVVGDLAYVVGGNPGLRIIDVSIPALPVELGALDTSYARDVKVVGDLAYVAGYPGLRTSPTPPCRWNSAPSTRRAPRPTSRWWATAPTWPMATSAYASSTSPTPHPRWSSASSTRRASRTTSR